MSTCATCKHWHEIDSDTNSAMARMGGPWDGTCGAVTYDLQSDRASLDWRITPIPASGVTVVVWLETRSDFGCVLWEAKE